MNMWEEVIQNKLLICPIFAWMVAQIIKTIINLIVHKEFKAERLIGSGGMPSSHSATVCAFATATGIIKGVGGFEFALSFILALIVMYDAMNVRMETGKQSMIINFWLHTEEVQQKLEKAGKDKWPEVILKEYVGHTPFQVFIGALLGIGIALLICF